MSTYFKAWNSTIAAADPSTYTPDPPKLVGQMCSGKPIVQGREQGTLVWDAMTLAGWIDLWDRYNTNKASSGVFVIPGRTSGQSWSTWRSTTSYVMEQPSCEYHALNVHRVSMRIVITA